MADTPPSGPDSMVERTKFAWERTATAVLAVTTVLLFSTKAPMASVRDALVVVTLLMAIAIYGIARSRGRLTPHTTPNGCRVVRAPNVATRLMGWGSVALAAVLFVAMLGLDK